MSGNHKAVKIRPAAMTVVTILVSVFFASIIIGSAYHLPAASMAGYPTAALLLWLTAIAGTAVLETVLLHYFFRLSIAWDHGTITISRYVRQRCPDGPTSRKAKYVRSVFPVTQIEKYGLAAECQPAVAGPAIAGRLGAACPQEIIFVLEDGTHVPWPAVSYSAKQVRNVCYMIIVATGLEPSGQLKQLLRK